MERNVLSTRDHRQQQRRKQVVSAVEHHIDEIHSLSSSYVVMKCDWQSVIYGVTPGVIFAK